MARYIDADKVMEEINRIGGHNLCEWETIGVKALIDRQPTADVVEVVRCKDCECYEEYPEKEDFDGFCLIHECETDRNEFCSYSSNALKERKNK